jgi:hypothetical protein
LSQQVEEEGVGMLFLQVEAQPFQALRMREQVVQVVQEEGEVRRLLEGQGQEEEEQAHRVKVVMVEQSGPMVVVVVEDGGVVEVVQVRPVQVNVQEVEEEVLLI